MTYKEVISKYGVGASNLTLFLMKLNESVGYTTELFETYLDDWYKSIYFNDKIFGCKEGTSEDVKELIIGTIDYWSGGYKNEAQQELVQKVKNYYFKDEKE